MKYFLYYFNGSKLHDFVHDMISEKEMADFVKKYYWIWDTRSKKEWTDKRIKIARQLRNRQSKLNDTKKRVIEEFDKLELFAG